MNRTIEILRDMYLENKQAYSGSAYIALRDKREGNVFWRVGGFYPVTHFELQFESNDEVEIINFCLAANDKQTGNGYLEYRDLGLS